MNFKCGFACLIYLSSLFISGCTGHSLDADWALLDSFIKENSTTQKYNVMEAVKRLSALSPHQLKSRQRMILAACFDKLDQPQNAVEQLQYVRDSDPEAADARLSEGQLYYFKLRNAKASEKALKKAIELKPDQVQALSRLATLFDLQNRIAERNECYLKLDSLSALDRDQLLLWTCNRRPDGLIQEAGIILKEFIDSDATDVPSQVALIDDLRYRGLFQEAVSQIQSSESILDKTLQNLLSAELKLDQGRFHEAELLLKNCILSEISSDHEIRFLVATARLDFYQKRYSDAEASLRRILQREPLNRQANQQIIQVLHIQKKSKDANTYEINLKKIDKLEDMAQKARATLHQNDTDWVNSIIKLTKDLKRFDLARAWLRTRLANDPLNHSIQQEIYQISQIIESGK